MGKTIPQVSLFAFFIGFSLATGSLAETAPVAPKKTIVFLGDSITAGYGLAKGDAYPALIQKKIEEAGLPYEVENAGLSGDTTAGALRRIDWLLQRPIHVLVIELGGNDGLRGMPPGVTEANLQSIIDKVRARSPLTRIMIAGMRLPPNLGADYTGEFEQVFSELATKNGAVLVPFLSRALAATEVSTSRIKSIRLPPGRRSSPKRCGRGCSHCCRRNELLGDARFQSFNVEMLEEPS